MEESLPNAKTLFKNLKNMTLEISLMEVFNTFSACFLEEHSVHKTSVKY